MHYIKQDYRKPDILWENMKDSSSINRFCCYYQTGPFARLNLSAWSNLMTQLFCRRLTDLKAKSLWGEVYGIRVEQKKRIVIYIRCIVCVFLGLPSCVELCIFGVVVCVWCNRSINNSAEVSVSSAAAPLLTGITPQDTLGWAREHGREREMYKRRWKERTKRAWMIRCQV